MNANCSATDPRFYKSSNAESSLISILADRKKNFRLKCSWFGLTKFWRPKCAQIFACSCFVAKSKKKNLQNSHESEVKLFSRRFFVKIRMISIRFRIYPGFFSNSLFQRNILFLASLLSSYEPSQRAILY